MTLTKEHLKTEIDALPDQFIGIIYHILRTFIQTPTTSLMSTAPIVPSTDSPSEVVNRNQEMAQSTEQQSHNLLGLFPNAGVTVGDLTKPMSMNEQPFKPAKGPRKAGSAKHLGITISDDFDEPLDDFAEYM